MPVYVVAVADVVNPEIMGKYLQQAGEALGKHGGGIISVGGPDEAALEDTGAASTARFVLIEFPTAEDAQGCISDPELKPIHDLRRGGAKTTIRLLTPR
jgi:uncharacterized protein (DUF1330 family)